MVRFQRLTGCRPIEVCLVRPCDVDTSGQVWVFRPESHKTEHHGRDRTICIGPKAQDILRKYLLRSSLPSGSRSRKTKVAIFVISGSMATNCCWCFAVTLHLAGLRLAIMGTILSMDRPRGTVLPKDRTAPRRAAIECVTAPLVRGTLEKANCYNAANVEVLERIGAQIDPADW